MLPSEHDKPLDAKVRFAKRHDIRERLTGNEWGDPRSGEFLLRAFESWAASCATAGEAYAAVRNAIREYQDTLSGSANPFGEDSRGRRRELRLITLVMADLNSEFAVSNLSESFHDAETRLDEEIDPGASLA